MNILKCPFHIATIALGWLKIWIRDRLMPGAIDKSFWSPTPQKYFWSECIEIKVTDCRPKIPPLIHFWASRSYQSQNSLGYTLKYSQLTHRVKSTKTELIGKSICSIKSFYLSSWKWNRFYTLTADLQQILHWSHDWCCLCNM